MIRGLELVLLYDFEEPLSRHAHLKNANEGVLAIARGRFSLSALLTKVEQIYELVGELLEIDHYLLFLLENVVVLLGAVELVDEVGVLFVSQLDSEDLRRGVGGCGSVDFDLDVKLSHVVFAVVASNLDLNWRLEKSLVELEQALLATSMPL